MTASPVFWPFRHEALPYAGAGDFVARAAPIVARAVEAGDPVLVAIDPAKIQLLRDRLGAASRAVAWKDIRSIGGNPARIIPVWRQFVARHASADRLWGFGEPIWAERSPAELVEAQRHEQLLNVAFAGVPNFTLLCPYDTLSLDPSVLHEGHRSHPVIAEDRGWRTSQDYPGLAAITAPLAAALPEPAGATSELVIHSAADRRLRAALAGPALAAGVGAQRAGDLAIAIAAVADAMAGPGEPCPVRVWQEPDRVLAELRDLTAVGDPLAGREWPAPATGPQRGLWLANLLCDLVQLRPSGAGAVVRLQIGR
jgi:hypothetical protein